MAEAAGLRRERKEAANIWEGRDYRGYVLVELDAGGCGRAGDGSDGGALGGVSCVDSGSSMGVSRREPGEKGLTDFTRVGEVTLNK